ncbi:MAG: hypothetical protein AB1397_01015 [bacterium]
MAVELCKVAEEIGLLSLEDKLFLKGLLEKMVIEERGQMIKKEEEEKMWSSLTMEQFFSGYSSKDSIYDNL